MNSLEIRSLELDAFGNIILKNDLEMKGIEVLRYLNTWIMKNMSDDIISNNLAYCVAHIRSPEEVPQLLMYILSQDRVDLMRVMYKRCDMCVLYKDRYLKESLKRCKSRSMKEYLESELYNTYKFSEESDYLSRPEYLYGY